ncbi:MAG: hypothetical protein KGL95_00080, partial [Patescibacteria group bacterium]|nr:hypothetical protein [Patescibacteria group bacterium]
TSGNTAEGISTQKELIDVLRTVRLQTQGRTDAYKGRGWDEIYRDAEKGEQLYAFNKEVQYAIQEFQAYMETDSHSRLDIQKALAATLLRLSKFFLQEQKQRQMEVSVGSIRRGNDAAFAYAQQSMSFGDVFSEVKKIEGCAGGGAAANGEVATSVLSLVHRLATVPGKKQEQGKDKKENMCGVCGRSVADNHYHCPKESGGCGRKYADETHAMSRTPQCGCGFKFNC